MLAENSHLGRRLHPGKATVAQDQDLVGFLLLAQRVSDDLSGQMAKISGAQIAFWLPVGKNQGRIVLQFAGIDTISDAETVAGLDVIVPREERLPLDDESVYISELVGCTVYDGIQPVGIVDDVHFAMTADGARRLDDAAPLLAVRSPEGDEVLIPFAKAFLVKVDADAKRIEMRLPEGLVEVNRSAGKAGTGEDQK